MLCRCPGCTLVAGSAQYSGLSNWGPAEAFNYICEIETDSDDDKIPDGRDYCPDTDAKLKNNVDANGCARYQVDPDRDRICSSTFPTVALMQPPVGSKWCTGVDNCDVVWNADQAYSVSGDATIGDACNTGV